MNPQANAGTPGGSAPQSAAPQVTLPKGGGAIRGIGEKFAANPVTGTGALTVPLGLSPGRSGFGPSLSLSYDSGSGNGPFGFGWSLSLPAITRKTDKGIPRYHDGEESDVFILSGAEDLVPVLREDGSRWEDGESVPGQLIHRYRPRVEGLFARVERWTDRATGEVHWRSVSADNVTTLYGRDDRSRIVDRSEARVFSWLICASYDDRGNATVYEYAAEDDAGVDLTRGSERNRARGANRYLKRILYGNRVSLLVQPELERAEWLFEAVFDYGEGHREALPLDPERAADEQHRYVRASARAAHPWAVRPDSFSSHRAGFEIRTHRRCRRVLMFHRFAELGGEPCLVRSTELEYADFDYTSPAGVEAELAHAGSTRSASFITAVTQCGYVRDEARPADAGFATYLCASVPPVELEYSRAEIREEVRELDAESLENLPVGLDGARRWVDLDGEGLSGILTEQADAWFYKRNLGGGRFGALERVATLPSTAALGGGQQLMDLAGDGRLEVVALGGPVPGFFERADDGWEPFRSFAHLPNVRWDDPNLRFVDLDGDGHADLLVSADDAFTWYPSLAEEGFGPARRVSQPHDDERGARLVLADAAQSIYLADMCGDGLADLVRITAQEVCYWPSLGHGRFGAKVVMDNAPCFDHPGQFEQDRVRLADIDGSGTTDIIYLGAGGARIYFNQSGNRWSDARPLRHFPEVDDVASVTAVDLLGNGTACLVWSSPLAGDTRRPLRYVELMSGGKPHLLVRSANNLGAETRVEYASSTRFYLEDRRAGKPWVTRLPFPVHVVTRTTVHDGVSGSRFVTRYAYHHGYFDGEEREFRGFGMVEQWDTEEMAALGDASNVDAASYVPPVLTRSWFHTGAYLDRAHVSDYFAGLLDARDTGEYYREPGLSDDAARVLLLDDTVLPAGLTPREEREACRTLRGSMLRQEVYALDGSAREPHPYRVTEQNFAIRVLQRHGVNRHGVFFSHALETLELHYERNPADPRAAHTMALEVDDFGNVLASAAIGYGRRRPDQSLAPADREKQARTLVTLQVNRVTNAVDSAAGHRAPRPCETRSYEITGMAPPAGRPFHTPAELRAAREAGEIDGEEPAPDRPGKRLLKHVRTLYRRDDLRGALPHGTMEAGALPWETYRLAITPRLADSVFGARATGELLAEGGYVRDQAGWWIPSGRVGYSPGPDDSPGDELEEARAHFFVPRRYRDPFHREGSPGDSFVRYDEYDLLVEETTDPLGNRVTAGERDRDPALPPVRRAHDYRVLQAALRMDPNRNRVAVAFDALGMVAATAAMGKPEEEPVPGDRLAGVRADLTRAEIDAFASDPTGPIAASLLCDATSRNVYDVHAFHRARRPAFGATIGRETHASEPLPAHGLRIRVTLSYSDGFAREIQTKLQAEPAAGGSSPRWVASGWTVFNNKGKPVRQFEPFFTGTHHYESDVRAGVSPVMFYDAAARPIATLHPDHSWSKVVFDAWRQESWDASDTVLVPDPADDPDAGAFFRRLPAREYLPTWHAARADGALGPREAAAARGAAVHAGTPTVAHADSLGRTFLTVAHNRFRRGEAVPRDERHHSRVELDVEGNTREVVDALGRVAARARFDLAGNRVHQASMEAGRRWILNDVAGKPVAAWDDRGHRFRTLYDELRRPTGILLREEDGPEQLVSRTVYGEGRPGAEHANLRGKAVELFDQAGVLVNDAYDFKGNLLRSRRQLARSYRATLDWHGEVPLEKEVFASETRFDALDRPLEVSAPDGSVVRPSYNQAGLMERIDARLSGAGEWTPFVAAAAYNARGQRTRIEYGNGVRTASAYDEHTFRLRRLSTRRDPTVFPDDCPRPPPAGWPGCRLQELSYTYDAVGNVTHARDGAQQTLFFRNRRVEPSSGYTYDALHRLIEATGREHLGRAGARPTPASHHDRPRTGLPLAESDGNAMGRYRERYTYDECGNLLGVAHRGNGDHAGWTRRFEYHEPSLLEPEKASNRLTRARVGNAREEFGYDAHGNVLRMQHLSAIEWNFHDQLRMTARRVAQSGEGERTWYVYDAGGVRIRKVTESGAGEAVRRSERIYLGGVEIYREYEGGTVSLERGTLHVVDGSDRVALVETRTVGDEPGVPARLVRFQLANRLGSATVELDEEARIVSYEEYTPFGSTSFQAAAGTERPARYRYTGKERDDESGLYYHGARYYAPWLCRWTGCDPAGVADGPNLYAYVGNNPVNLVDPTGHDGTDAQGMMAGMMWDQMGREISAIIEGFFGGSAYVNPRANVVQYSGPQNGVGGVVGGVARAATLRAIPIEDNPSPFSLMGMEAGAGVVPVMDPAARLVTGTTVTGLDASRWWAGAQLALDLVPLGMELRALSAERRMLSMQSRAVSSESRLIRIGADELDAASHIGSGGNAPMRPTTTNPLCRNDLCVADVGSHEANRWLAPGEAPVTNIEFVAASGREVSVMTARIENTGEAASLLNAGFESLYQSGRITQPLRASVPLEPVLQPGNYVAIVSGPQGAHAIHATVTPTVTGQRFISGGKVVSAAEAADLIADEVRVVRQDLYGVEYYDPQVGMCVQPATTPTSYLRLQ